MDALDRVQRRLRRFAARYATIHANHAHAFFDGHQP
jgi:hypothetical protein